MPNTLRHAVPRGRACPGQGFYAEHVFPATPEAVPAGRATVKGTFAAWGLGAITEPAELVASELLTNAVRQGARTSPAEILVRLTRTPCFGIIQVGDHSPDVPPRPPRKVDGAAEHARGLLIANVLAEQLAWYEQDGWKLVWVAVRAATLGRHPASRSQLRRAA